MKQFVIIKEQQVMQEQQRKRFMNILAVSKQRQKVELEPGTFIVRMVPFTIIVGDPTKVHRTDRLTFEDIQVERDSFKTLAIPAS